MEGKDKNIYDMLDVKQGDISSKDFLKRCHIDTIVNAANPTLMGSNQGVDGAIHKAIDALLASANTTFNREICREIDYDNSVSQNEKIEETARIRCRRGKAVMTKGYGLCNYVIHVVGSEYDGISGADSDLEKERNNKNRSCSSSRIQTLESCYYEIVKLIRQHPDIKSVAVPIISSGLYGFPFDLAARIAVASIGNALINWKQKDREEFNQSGIKKIYFFTENSEKGSRDYSNIWKFFTEYKKILQEENQVVFQNSFVSQAQYFKEIKQYDKNRGYFAIAKVFRLLLLCLRMIFGVITNLIKDKCGGENWQRRRNTVEVITLSKIAVPFIAWGIVKFCPSIMETWGVYLLNCLIFYFMVDTVTYLLVLIMLADIQKPSANVIRSLILLLCNYLEVSLAMSYFYYVCHDGAIYRQALDFGILGTRAAAAGVYSLMDYVLIYGNTMLKFFFITVMFGYLVKHMRQRRFRGAE